MDLEMSQANPAEYLWVYDPEKAIVHVEPGEEDHPAHFPTHRTMAQHVTHPDRVQGYAYVIKGGYRITDDEHRKVEDPYIVKQILAALHHERPAPPLPSVLPHGDPERRTHRRVSDWTDKLRHDTRIT